MRIIKLGGSVITEKDRPLTPREDVIKRIGEEIKPAYPNMILTHGTGSFGHYLALKYQIHRGFHGKDMERIGLGETKYWVNVLTQMIIRSMLDAEIPVFPFFASSLGVMEGGKFVKFDFEPIEGYLKMGIVPLIPADGPVDRKFGALIASGDYLSYLLAEHFKADEVIFTIDQDGLIWDNEVLEKLNLAELMEIYNKMEMGKDATGGMKGKLKYVIEILKIGVPVRIVNLTKPNVLKNLLEGGNPLHTYIKP